MKSEYLTDKTRAFHYLQVILKLIKRIREILGNSTYLEFKSNEMLQEAVAYRILNIGEAVANIPAELIENFPSIPWRKIVQMRNHLVHRYHRVDMDSVWEVATGKLNELEYVVFSILENLKSQMPESELPKLDARC